MPSDTLAQMLADRDWLMADGATGTTLFNMGLTSGDSPELWNVEQPNNIRALYRGGVGHLSHQFLRRHRGAAETA